MSLLMSEHSIAYFPTVAKRTTVNQAILAQFIYFWQVAKKTNVGVVSQGQRWIYNTYAAFAEETGLTEKQVRTALDELSAAGILEAKPLREVVPKEQRQRFNLDRTKAYRVNAEHAVFQAPSTDLPCGADGAAPTALEGTSICPVGRMELPCGADVPLTESTTESTTEREGVASDDTPRPPRKKQQAANAQRELSVAEEALLPGVRKCAEIINDARMDAGLKVVEQNEREAAVTLRQLIEHEKLPREMIVPLCRWMMHEDNKSREYHLQTLSLIHCWRKQWAKGKAIMTVYDDFCLAVNRVGKAKATRPTQQTDSRGVVEL